MLTRRTGIDGRRRASVAAWAAVAPLALLAVASWHVGLRASSDLTPWKGGGFGMFSTVDSPGTRLVRVEVTSPLGRTPVAVPAHLRDLAGAVRAAPSDGRMSALAQALAGELWVTPRLPGADVAGSPEDAALDRLAVEALATVAPVDTVRAVAPGAFDPAAQERLEVESVEVEVFRLTVDEDGRDPGTGGTAVRPVAIAQATATAATAAAGSGAGGTR